jgi:hypothetical protein
VNRGCAWATPCVVTRIALVCIAAGCSASKTSDFTQPPTPNGGSSGSSGSTNAPNPPEASAPEESSAPAPPEASTGSSGGPGDASSDDASPTDAAGDDASQPIAVGDGSFPSGDPSTYGGVGQLPSIPLQYTTTPVPPVVQMDCPGDPTAGFTEYMDSFVIQRPYDLAASDRFSYENGIYTFWVLPTDKPHAMGNGTAPRTEARYSNMSTGTHMWTGDVMFEMVQDTCIMQIHNVVGSIAAYYRVLNGRTFNLGTGTTIMMGNYNTWFNLKVSFNMQTLQVNTWVNNCLKDTHTSPGGTPNWYFKNGVYTCQAAMCRDHFKNIHLYQK